MAHHLDLKYPSGILKAEFVRFLKNNECPCKIEKLQDYFTQGNRVYKKIPFKFNPK